MQVRKWPQAAGYTYTYIAGQKAFNSSPTIADIRVWQQSLLPKCQRKASLIVMHRLGPSYIKKNLFGPMAIKTEVED